MASLNELTYNILNIIRGGKTSDDEPFSNDQIAFMIGYYRSVLAKKDWLKNKKFDLQLVQDLGCVPVQKVDKAECCTFTDNCNVVRTVDKVPITIGGDSNGFTFIGRVDKRTSYSFLSKSQSHWASHNRFTANIPRSYYHNGYIYVDNLENLDIKVINIQGVFDEPLKVTAYLNEHDCKETSCITADDDYPMPAWMVSYITESILSKEMNFGVQAIRDTENNAQGLNGGKAN